MTGIEWWVQLVESRHRVPDRGVVVLRATQSVEQLLAVRAARALLSNGAAGGHQIHFRERRAKILEKFGEVKIGKPRIDDDSLRRGGVCLGPRLGPAFGLAYLPAQAGKSLGEPLPEAAIGAGHKRRARPNAIDGWQSGNGNGHA